MTKDKFIEQLNNKKIVIRGAGTLAKKFYATYGGILEISYCTTNRSGESIDGLTRIELKEILEQKDDYFIIVCIGNYEAVSFQLISEGLLPERNFSSYEIVTGIIEKKKLLLAVGQCELAVTDFIFQNMPSIRKEYCTLYYDEYKVLGIADKEPRLQCVLELNELIELTDYFIYPVNLSARREYYDRLLSKVSPECCTISVPLSTFEGYWPQDNKKDYYEKSAYYLTPYSLKFRRDINLERAFEDKKEEEVLQNIAKENFYDEAEITKYFEKTIKKFEIMDRKSDVKISDYYKDNYKTRKLFLDRGHAATFVLKEYAKRILESCGIDFELQEIESVDLKWYDECHSEFPIYPSVRRQLNLNDNKRYRLINGEKIIYLNFEEYINMIYKYIKKGMEYLEEDKYEGKDNMYSK